MIDAVCVDWGTPRLAARCVGSLDSDLFASIELVDAKARGWSYAQSVNRSLARATAPYVLALNADTRMLEPPDQIVALFEEHADIAVIGPRQIDDHGLITHAGIVGDNFHRSHRFWKQPLEQVDRFCGECALDVPTISGSVYFARRSVWEQLGGFLETALYYEETGLDFRVRHEGWRVVYTGATTWEHLWAQSPVELADRSALAAESRQVFRRYCLQHGIDCD
jgi:GT2 family glycosyltransferase